MGFMKMNILEFSTVKAVGTPRPPGAVETVDVLRSKECFTQQATGGHSGTCWKDDPGIPGLFPCFWLSSDTSTIQSSQYSFVWGGSVLYSPGSWALQGLFSCVYGCLLVVFYEKIEAGISCWDQLQNYFIDMWQWNSFKTLPEYYNTQKSLLF